MTGPPQRRRTGRAPQLGPGAFRVGDVLTHALHHVEREDELRLPRVPPALHRGDVEAFADECREVFRRLEAAVAAQVVVPPVHRDLVAVLAVDLGPGLVRRRLGLEDEAVEVEYKRAYYRCRAISTASDSASRPSGCGFVTFTRTSDTFANSARRAFATSAAIRSTSARGRSATEARTA